jgi:hypothetical protein
MRFTTLTAFLLPSAILAVPTALETRADENCTPSSYTLSDFTLVTSPTAAYLNFNFKSTFANTAGIVDSVITGSNCQASGSSIPNSNVCSAPDRKLLFDLRAPQDQARYQITHTWVCNGKTWMSGNDVTASPLNCNTVDNVRSCSGGSQTFAPQNVRVICNAPRC